MYQALGQNLYIFILSFFMKTTKFSRFYNYPNLADNKGRLKELKKFVPWWAVKKRVESGFEPRSDLGQNN